jgi:hypothetical protein
MRRIQRPGGTGTAGRSGYTLGIKVQKQSFPFYAYKTEVRVVGQAFVFFCAIQLGVRHSLQDFIYEAVA